MREIKFRGKTTLSEKWVFGSLVIAETNFFIVISKMIKNWVTDYSHETVTSETVGQYTGLKDKNGKEIYEGDIVTISARSSDEYMWFLDDKICIVVIDPNIYFKEIKTGDYIELFGEYGMGSIKVIGNIHENPDLGRMR